jgi:predicted methyltransferase
MNKTGKPQRICAIDASTNSLAYALFVDEELNQFGKINFQGKDIYEINHKLVSLKEPMMTIDGIEDLHKLMDDPLEQGEFKKVYVMMKKDGLDKEMSDYRYEDFLIPFKSLINR